MRTLLHLLTLLLASAIPAQLGPWVTPANSLHYCIGTTNAGTSDTAFSIVPLPNPVCGCITNPFTGAPGTLGISCLTEAPSTIDPCLRNPRWNQTMTVYTQVDLAVANSVAAFFGMWFEPLGTQAWPTQLPVPGAFPTANIAFPSPGYSVSLRNATMSVDQFGIRALGANIVFPAYNPAWAPTLPVRVQAMIVNGNGDLVFGQAFYTLVTP